MRFGLGSIDYRLLDTLRPQPFDLLACLDDLAACGCKIGLIVLVWPINSAWLRCICVNSKWLVNLVQKRFLPVKIFLDNFQLLLDGLLLCIQTGNPLVKRFHALVQNILLGFEAVEARAELLHLLVKHTRQFRICGLLDKVA